MNRTLLRDAPAWLMSLVINLTALGALHFIVLYKPATVSETIIDSNVDTEEGAVDEDYSFVNIMDTQGQRDGDASRMGAGGGGGTEGMAAMVSGNAAMKSRVASEMSGGFDAQPVNLQLNVSDILVAPTGEVATSLVAVASKGTVDDAKGGTPGVMDRLSFEIAQSCKERPTLVLWMFDASLSLEKKRAAVADRFEIVYEQLAKQSKEGILYTAVMTYGDKFAFLTDEPVTDVSELVTSVKKIPNDVSGNENVFTAVLEGVRKYKNFGKGKGKYNKMVIIITDERGDDAGVKDNPNAGMGRLELAISEAKKSQFRVNCVGTAAVFGQEKGYVEYTYEDGERESLPVDQGPETYYPELVQLPMWSGNRLFDRVSSSFGPYALTRLCAETSGIYLIMDDAKGQPFDRLIMRNYTPDYRPIDKITADVQASPAKAGLVALAEATLGRGGRPFYIPEPQMTFRGYTDNLIRNECTEAQKPMAIVNAELEPLKKKMEDIEKHRATLKESRWQASFDLAAGRVFAMYARSKGYQLMLANMKTTPKTYEKKDSNMWRIVPSANIETGPDVKKMAEKARTYLKRVVDMHAGTPWAAIATRELADDFGWSWEEYHVDLPGGMNGPVRDEDVPRLLLAEEEARQMRNQPRGPAPKPREKPKL